MYSVYQHWDKLKVCIVGRSYPPEFYSYITNPRVRNVMERIAIETEEDFQKLIKLLESFNVKVLRPELKDSIEYYKRSDGKYISPPMTPRDYSGMFGEKFYFSQDLRYKKIFKHVREVGNKIYFRNDIDTSNITRVGKDLYFGTSPDPEHDLNLSYKLKLFPKYRHHIVNTRGHNDGCFCPVIPGLIISLFNIQTYEKTFPGWEVIYLPNQSWVRVEPFLKLKDKNEGKWWMPGEELNDDFIYN